MAINQEDSFFDEAVDSIMNPDQENAGRECNKGWILQGHVLVGSLIEKPAQALEVRLPG